jgi:hypothetical protein
LELLVVQPVNIRPATPIAAAARPTRRKTGKVSNMELSFVVVTLHQCTGQIRQRKARDCVKRNKTLPAAAGPARRYRMP